MGLVLRDVYYRRLYRSRCADAAWYYTQGRLLQALALVYFGTTLGWVYSRMKTVGGCSNSPYPIGWVLRIETVSAPGPAVPIGWCIRDRNGDVCSLASGSIGSVLPGIETVGGCSCPFVPIGWVYSRNVYYRWLFLSSCIYGFSMLQLYWSGWFLSGCADRLDVMGVLYNGVISLLVVGCWFTQPSSSSLLVKTSYWDLVVFPWIEYFLSRISIFRLVSSGDEFCTWLS